MKTIITTLLLASFSLGYAQECDILIPRNVNVMGISRTDIDLDEVETVTLPIVFHIVHTGAGEVNNISNEQVLSQLDVLNEEFEESKIQFCIAQRDPDGNPTNGITRYDAGWNPVYVEDGVSNASGQPGWPEDQMKAASGCWNPSEYLNFYIVSEINGNDGGYGVQGFSYLGPTNDCKDGPVVLYNATGTEGEIKPGRTLGFTGVHEVGHYLSLWHTFSNTVSCVESNCEVQGDQVCDTPPTATNFVCSSPSCPDALVENFMDYTDESCKDSFTVGQSERMYGQIVNQRASLLDNLSCIPVVDYDVTPSAAYYQENWCAPYQDIWVDVLNQGALPVGAVYVDLYCNGNQYTKFFSSIDPGIEEVLFENVFVDGAQMFEVQVDASVDQYPDNDYNSWPIQYSNGELLTVFVETDYSAPFLSWGLYDEFGSMILGDEDYPYGEESYQYSVCLFDGCYTVEINDLMGNGFCQLDWNNDGVCDYGATDGISGYINGEVVFSTEYGETFSTWDSTFCVEIDDCPLDFDGNGTIGNGDLIIMLNEYGCLGDCETDPNNDGIISVMDLIYFLQHVGDVCQVEEDLSMGMVKELAVTSASAGGLFGGKPRIFDITGREIKGPVDNLATGVYVLKWKNVTKKVFVQ